jgi:hypothetical protein
VAQQVSKPRRRMGWLMLTISKLKRWSISYYIDTASTAERATTDLRAAGGGLGEYYSERETRTPVWLCAGDTRAAASLVGLSDVQRAGGENHRRRSYSGRQAAHCSAREQSRDECCVI